MNFQDLNRQSSESSQQSDRSSFWDRDIFPTSSEDAVDSWNKSDFKTDSKYAYRDAPLRSSTDSEDDFKPICRPKLHVHSQNVTSDRETLRQIRRRRIALPSGKGDASKPTSVETKHGSSHIVGLRKDSPTEGTKIKTKREPLPMCRRALPHSFFKEPQSIHTSSLAGDFYPVLPPLFPSETNDDVTDVRPVTPPHEKAQPQPPKKAYRSTQPDTELLFSLFDHLEEPFDKRLLVRRGRPKKQFVEKPRAPPSRRENEDPCIVDALSERFFPKLSLNNNNTKKSGDAPLQIGVIRYNNGGKTLEFPAIPNEQNYSAMLNELVTHM